MKSDSILALGVASVGATLGYMVGGSASPVVGVAVPAIFGLVVASLGLLQANQPSKEFLEFLKTHGESANSLPEVAEYRSRVRMAPARLGVLLMVFSAAYLVAATIGAKVRIGKLLVPSIPAAAFPWDANTTKPATIAEALQWLALQSRLIELGYNDDRIRELYGIQAVEWQRAAQSEDLAATRPQAGASAPRTVDRPATALIDLPSRSAHRPGAASSASTSAAANTAPAQRGGSAPSVAVEGTRLPQQQTDAAGLKPQAAAAQPSASKPQLVDLLRGANPRVDPSCPGPACPN